MPQKDLCMVQDPKTRNLKKSFFTPTSVLKALNDGRSFTIETANVLFIFTAKLNVFFYHINFLQIFSVRGVRIFEISNMNKIFSLLQTDSIRKLHIWNLPNIHTNCEYSS